MINFVVSLMLCILFMNGGVLNANMMVTGSCIEKERQALLDVKANLIDLHGEFDGWGGDGEEIDCCKWTGVSCDNHTSHVIELDFSFHRYRVKGKISQSLQVLNQLQYLNLNYIDFLSDPLPGFLGSLSNLQRLHISGANLSGHIPRQLSNLSNLLRLDLSGNSFCGSIPFSFGDLTSLTYLDLSQNQLEGVIPNIFGNYSNLKYLNVSRNSLNGTIPDFIRCHALCFLDMSSNQLSGNVPNSMGQVSNLRLLDLSCNSLKGVISEVHFLNLTRLDYLDLSFNTLALDLSSDWISPFQLLTIKLQSCKLGPMFPLWIKTQRKFMHLDISSAGISDNIPGWFWELPSRLKFLNLSSNQMKGMIPDMTSYFDGYPGIDLSNNQLEGSVPLLPSKLASLNLSGNRFSGTLSFLCKIDGVLTFLDLSSNSFSGSLPDCWSQFQEKLVVLNLSNNKLSGEIPSSLGFLSNLEALYLRSNAFVGEVPMSLSNCTQLRFLDLGENKLSGFIPEWIGENLLELYVLVLGSNRFYGRLPSQVCRLHNLQLLDLSNNGLSGYIPRCFDNFTAMGRSDFGDDMTNHLYFCYVPFSKQPSQGTEKPYTRGSAGSRSKKARFLDNAWVTWKGTTRLFGRGGLHLLKSIDLSRNKLSGSLPYEITSLTGLVSLNLSINNLHGEVPEVIGLLKSLESLDLSRNEFTGNIPWSLAQLNFLSYLDLSFNSLSGRIPTGSQLQRFNYTSYSGNLQLCGPPLTPRCVFQAAVGTKDVEEDEDDSWKSYYTGSRIGFAFGFSGICGVLFINHSFRYFFFSSLIYMVDWIYATVAALIGKLVRMF